MGGWVIQSPILGTAISIERLEKCGYISLASMYNQITSKLFHKANSLFPMMWRTAAYVPKFGKPSGLCKLKEGAKLAYVRCCEWSSGRLLAYRRFTITLS